MKLFLFLLCLVTLVACGQTPHELAGSSWTLQSYGPKDAQQNILATTTITLRFEQTNAGGSSGCNSYGGELTVRGTNISIKRMFSTEMACIDTIMAQEASYLDLLQRVTTFEKTDTTLTLIAGEERLEFTSQ